jgi:yecA family protein
MLPPLRRPLSYSSQVSSFREVHYNGFPLCERCQPTGVVWYTVAVASTLKPFAQPEPLTDAELDRLGGFLKGCKSGRAMNVEQLDGFFAALIAGPETVMTSEYNREVFGGEVSDACEFSSLEEANEIFGLMMRHWNTIAGTLRKGEHHIPLLLEDENGVALGNDWARGFMRGMRMRHDGWAELVNDEKHGGCLIPLMMLDDCAGQRLADVRFRAHQRDRESKSDRMGSSSDYEDRGSEGWQLDRPR